MTEIEVCKISEQLFKPYQELYPDLYILENCRKYDILVFKIGYKGEEPPIDTDYIEDMEESISVYINRLFYFILRSMDYENIK